MLYIEREKIFSKDYLTIEDLQSLLGMPYQTAARVMRQIKFKCDRLQIQGRIHVEDYFEYFNITDRQRYLFDGVGGCKIFANKQELYDSCSAGMGDKFYATAVYSENGELLGYKKSFID